MLRRPLYGDCFGGLGLPAYAPLKIKCPKEIADDLDLLKPLCSAFKMEFS